MNFIKNIAELDNNSIYLTNQKQYKMNTQKKLVYIWDFIEKKEFIEAKTNQSLVENLADYTIEVEKINNENILFIQPPILKNIQKSISETLKTEKPKPVEQTENINHIPHKGNIYRYLRKLSATYHKSNYISEKKIDELYSKIDTILNEDMTDEITRYKEKNDIYKEWYVYNSLISHKQTWRITSVIKKFFASLSNDEKGWVLNNTEREWYDNILSECSAYLYDKYHSKDIEIVTYNNAVSILENNLISLNDIFFDKHIPLTTKFHPNVEKLFDGIMSYIQSITNKPDNISEIIDEINDNIIDWFREKYIEWLNPQEKKKYDWIFAMIEECLTIVIELKNYQENNNTSTIWLVKESTTEILSARDIFNKICKYNKWNENENLINSIKKLQECEDKEITNLLSNNELKELLDIITQEEEYEFAARIAKILDIDTK